MSKLIVAWHNHCRCRSSMEQRRESRAHCVSSVIELSPVRCEHYGLKDDTFDGTTSSEVQRNSGLTIITAYNAGRGPRPCD